MTPTRYISLEEMTSLTGKSYKSLWRMWSKTGDFPRPHKTKGGAFLGWPVTVYEDWVSKQSLN